MPVDPGLATLLESDPERRDRDWERVLSWLSRRFGPVESLEAVLFIVGLQESGRGYEPQLTKEQKQELIMEGTYAALAEVGVCERTSDEDGHAMWSRRIDTRRLTSDEQATLLRIGLVRNLTRYVPEG